MNLNFCKGHIAGRRHCGHCASTGGRSRRNSEQHGAHFRFRRLDPIKIVFRSAKRNISGQRTASRRHRNATIKTAEFIDPILADGKTFPNKARLLAVDRQVNASTGTILVTAVLKNPQRCGRACLHERASPRAPQGRRCRAAAGGDGSQGSYSACHRWHRREGGNSPRAGRAARGHGPG